jgi:hypothetical protein
MEEVESYRKSFTVAMRLLLMRWNQWVAEDEIRAMAIGFDCFNTEISINLLTDREPRAEGLGIDPLAEPWSVDSWRLSHISRTGKHCFPDAHDFVEWMKAQARTKALSEIEVRAVNLAVKRLIAEVATSQPILNEIKRFSKVAPDFRIRVEWFFDDGPPFDYVLQPT